MKTYIKVITTALGCMLLAGQSYSQNSKENTQAQPSSAIKGSLEKIIKLEPVWLLPTTTSSSVAAGRQEPTPGFELEKMKELFPQAVVRIAKQKSSGKNQFRQTISEQVDPVKLIPFLIEALISQQAQIESLRSERNSPKSN